MSCKDVLKQLFPLDLLGVFEKDIELEGRHLDDALERSSQLLAQIFPDTADELLTDWERVYGLTPGSDDPLQLRRNRVVAKRRETGRLDRQYFIDLAATFGIEITIDELAAGENGYGPEGIFVWRINILNVETEDFYFRAGESVAGDLLMWWTAEVDIDKNLFNDLKPAHTLALYVYPA